MADTEWYEQLYDEYAASVYRLAARKLRSHPGHLLEAEDMVQDVFLLALQHDIQSHPCPVGWLIRTTDLVCWGWIRRRQRSALAQQVAWDPVLLFPAETPESIAISTIDAQAALHLIERQLTRQDWELLKAYLTDSITAETLASRHGISIGTLRVRIHRLRSKITFCYQAWDQRQGG